MSQAVLTNDDTDSSDHGPGQEPVRALHVRTVALCAMVAILDGFDNQVVGVVAPLIRVDLGLHAEQLGAIFSITQVGATIGALLFGPLGDRLGRKPAILISIAMMTVFTWATTITPSFALLLAIRFMAGIGLAGVLSSALALTSEYAPRRLRGAFVATVYAGYPAGAAIGGVTAALVLARNGHDWRAMFQIGVLLGLVALVSIALWLPESARLQRARLQRPIPAQRAPAPPTPSLTPTPGRVSLWAVFGQGLALLTVLLCLMNAFVAATTKIMVAWLPSLLTANGFTVSQGALAQAVFNTGGILPMILAGWLIDRLGPQRVLIPAMLLNTAALVGLSFAGHSFATTLAFTAVIGACIGINAGGGPVLAARLYAVAIRSTGMGWGVAASRVGSIISPMVVALFLAQGSSGASVFRGLAAAPLLAAAAIIAFVAVERRRQPPAA